MPAAPYLVGVDLDFAQLFARRIKDGIYLRSPPFGFLHHMQRASSTASTCARHLLVSCTTRSLHQARHLLAPATFWFPAPRAACIKHGIYLRPPPFGFLHHTQRASRTASACTPTSWCPLWASLMSWRARLRWRAGQQRKCRLAQVCCRQHVLFSLSLPLFLSSLCFSSPHSLSPTHTHTFTITHARVCMHNLCVCV